MADSGLSGLWAETVGPTQARKLVGFHILMRLSSYSSNKDVLTYRWVFLTDLRFIGLRAQNGPTEPDVHRASRTPLSRKLPETSGRIPQLKSFPAFRDYCLWDEPSGTNFEESTD